MNNDADERFLELSRETAPGRFGPARAEEKEEALTVEKALDVLRATDLGPRRTVEPHATVEGHATVEAVAGEPVVPPLATVEPALLHDISTAARKVSTWDILRYADKGGKAQSLKTPELKVWSLRLEVERGISTPVSVPALPIDVEATELALHVYERFVYLLSIRWLVDYGDPAPWTHDFSSRWCQIKYWEARKARAELVRIGSLIATGDYTGKGQYKAALWYPRGFEGRST